MSLIATSLPQTVTDETIASLRKTFRGPLLRAGEPGYDEARVVWNAMYSQRRPALIARCLNAADVVGIVNFAREGGWSPAVRGGGHNVTGHSTCDDDLIIDLSLMRGVRVDPDRRTARAEGGALLADLDRCTQLYGLATPSGVVSHTGVAGLTLGGGHGRLTRKYGFTVDSLLSVDVVTADGTLRVANQQQAPDLFWAVRGGGGNFGVVTSFEFKLYPLGPMLWAETVAWPADNAGDVLRFWRDWVAGQPPEVATNATVVIAPGDLHGTSGLGGQRLIVVQMAWHGSLEQAQAQFRQVREFSSPVMTVGGPISYTELQSINDNIACSPFGFRVYFKTSYLQSVSDAAIDVMASWAPTLPAASGYIELNSIDGPANHVPADATALGSRKARFNHTIATAWTDPADDAENIAWARAYYAAMESHYDGGVYINYVDRGESDRLIRSAYSERNWTRLRTIKQRYDPGNLFRRNQNIPPLGS
jgi:FAD/FMN-containing dehydrogenase